MFGDPLVGNGHRPFRRTHRIDYRTPAYPHDLPPCHSEERSDAGISWNIVQIRTTYQEIAAAYGLVMTWKIEPGPSFGGAARTPREGCPYGKTCRAVGLRPPLAIHGGYRDDREGRPYTRHKNSPPT